MKNLTLIQEKVIEIIIKKIFLTINNQYIHIIHIHLYNLNK
jgi:hypothetical protein